MCEESTSGAGQLTLTDLTMTCRAMPSQWDAVDSEGVDYYIRYRHGHLTVYEGGPGGDLIYRTDYGDRHDGTLSEDQLRALTTGLFDWSEVGDDG